MTDAPEENARRAAQRRALSVDPGGARIETSYLKRTNEVVAVNRNDLSDLIQFDGIEFGLTTGGQFFLAGGLWLFVEKFFSADFKWDALAGFCLASAIFGAILWYAGSKVRNVKQTKINRIFEESTPV